MNRKTSWISGLLCLCLVFGLTGCATRQGADQRNDRGYEMTRVIDRTEPDLNNSVRSRNRGTYNGTQIRANDRLNMNGPMDVTDNNRMNRGVRASRKVAQQVANLPEINTAAAIVMNRNAYVAVTLKAKRGDGKVTEQLKDKVSKRAKAADPTLRNVYVSANPDFVKQINNYVNDLQNGRPVSGFIKNLNDILRRTFPEAK
ncbi:MAG: YhcN/YlaJ family sporulation lipoprotein [Thermoactinomyces sp.]